MEKTVGGVVVTRYIESVPKKMHYHCWVDT